MKNKRLVYHYQSAKIYRHYYRPSFNLWRLVKSVLLIFISGSSVASSHYRRIK